MKTRSTFRYLSKLMILMLLMIMLLTLMMMWQHLGLFFLLKETSCFFLYFLDFIMIIGQVPLECLNTLYFITLYFRFSFYLFRLRFVFFLKLRLLVLGFRSTNVEIFFLYLLLLMFRSTDPSGPHSVSGQVWCGCGAGSEPYRSQDPHHCQADGHHATWHTGP